jgi:pimeloyl-ACP methyl ester carboxylesterase
MQPDRRGAEGSRSRQREQRLRQARYDCPPPNINGGINSTSPRTATREGYTEYRRDFAKLIWKTASQKWNFDDATFERSASAFDNSDHVDIVIHNYRWRMGLADGERRYDDLETKLALAPTIGVPTITLEGDANGAPHPEPAAYAGKFTGKYVHRTMSGGIGHNLPQEAPEAFAKAVVEVGDEAGQ